MSKKREKPTSFGLSFDRYLRNLESIEDYMNNPHPKNVPSVMIERGGLKYREDWQLNAAGEVDAKDHWGGGAMQTYYMAEAAKAAAARNSFKFKLELGIKQDWDSADTSDETTMSPPFPNTVLLVTGADDGVNDVIFLMEKRKFSDHGKLGRGFIDSRWSGQETFVEAVEGAGDEFVAISMSIVSPESVALVPVEWLVPLNLTFREAKKTDGVIRAIGADFISGEITEEFVEFAGSVMGDLFHVMGVMDTQPLARQPGLPPRSRKPSMKHGRRVFYEHHTVMIDPWAKQPESSGLGGTHASPRLHAVRGHWRRYNRELKDGSNKVWVEPHWRGDADKGVVTKDYELKGENPQGAFRRMLEGLKRKWQGAIA